MWWTAIPYQEVLELGPRDPTTYIVNYFYDEKSSWIRLPRSLTERLLTAGSTLPLPVAIHVDQPPGGSLQAPVYLAWAGQSCDPGCVGIPGPVGRSLSLRPGTRVSITPLANVPSAASVTVEPASVDDWEIVELNASSIEGQFLSQVGVACRGQPLCTWVHGQIILLTVVATVPATPLVKLVDGTEMLIAPRPRHHPPKEKNVDEEKKVGKDRGGPLATVLRLQSLETLEILEIDESHAQVPDSGVHRALVSEWTLQRCGLYQGDYVSLQGPRGGQLSAQITGTSSNALGCGHIGLEASTLLAMGARPCDALRVTRVARPSSLDDHEEHMHSPFENDASSKPHYKPRSTNSISVDFSSVKEPGSVPTPTQHEAALALLKVVLPVVASVPRTVLQRWGAPRPGAALLAGPAESGKSWLFRHLRHALSTHPGCLTAVEIIECKALMSEAEARKRILDAFKNAVSRPPAMVIFDDLDVICPAQSDGGQTPEGGGLVLHGGLVAFLCEIIDDIVAAQERWAPEQGAGGVLGGGHWMPISIVASCQDATGLDPRLREAGRFESIFSLQAASIVSREVVLTAGASVRGAAIPSDVATTIAARTDGFNLGDIGLLLDRAMAMAVSNRLGSSPSTVQVGRQFMLTAEELERAMVGMTPAALWGSGTRTSIQAGVKGWEDVGGMSPVREALCEALELPLRHAGLIATAPLRLRTGVLLYGPPGCGKTHVVAAAVAAIGVRCITVSGPELLNKYIGASEAGVRDVFRRAAAAAPSVLFFDEFDAMAPQRGHDNTGVSDRVVNQLLTELDGVEGLKGVCVIAATSRPDLIDVALLRPGRLDRLLMCGFPTQNERREILEAMSRKLTLAPDVDLAAVAARTEGFSGADLGAILADAQLAAAHEALQELEAVAGDVVKKTHGGVIIAYRHIIEAMHGARPSVSAAERARLDYIYSHFETGELRGAVTEQVGGAKKVSWA